MTFEILFLRMLPHSAPIEQIQIRVRRLVRQRISLPPQRPDDELAIEHVHLATDGFDEEFFGHGVIIGEIRVFARVPEECRTGPSTSLALDRASFPQ